MKYVTSILLYIVLVLCAVGCAAPEGSIAVQGVVSKMEGLAEEQPIDLYLDRLSFAGEIWDNSWSLFSYDETENDVVEIHITDASNETMLACIGPAQASELAKVGYGALTYAQLDAQFIGTSDFLATDADVNIRIIQKKHFSARCPAGPNEQSTDPQTPVEELKDRLVAEHSVAVSTLLSGEDITIPEVSILNTRPATGATTAIDVAANVEGGALSVNQLHTNRSTFLDGEDSAPELVLLMLESGTLKPFGCADLTHVNMAGLLYADLEYPMLDLDLNPITLADLNVDADYYFILGEMDEGTCFDLNGPDATGLGFAILSYTDWVKPSALVEQPIAFIDEYGSMSLVTQ